MSAFLRGFARGGALALWVAGPLLALVGVISGMPVLVVLGGIAFVAGGAMLWGMARQGGNERWHG